MIDWGSILAGAIVIFLSAMLMLALVPSVVEMTSFLLSVAGDDAATSLLGGSPSCGTGPRAATEALA